MTRFARYSTKGIKKPPLEATPWSELAPPAAAKHALAAAASNTEKPMRKNKKRKSPADGAVPQVSTIDFDGPGSVPKELEEPTFERMGNKCEHDDRHMKSPASQSTKKKRRPAEDAALPDDIERDENRAPAAEPSEVGNGITTAKKGTKRQGDGSAIPKKKKKRPSIGNEAQDIADVSEDQQLGDFPEQTAFSKPTPKNHNGGVGPAFKRSKQKQNGQKKPMLVGTAGPPLLAEGPLMTQFEGYWVRRRAVPRLKKVRAELAAAISDPQTLKREMKKRKRAEHRLLLSQLAARGARRPASAAARLQGETDDAEDGLEEDPATKDADGDDGDHAECDEEAEDEDEDAATRSSGPEQPPRRRTVADDRNPSSSGSPREDRMVKFDGIWMTADAVGRLKELRRQLKRQRVSEVVLKQTMKTARRREEMKRKRDAKRVCLGCRQPGHMISDCPHRAAGVKAPVTGLCFRCGSTEHRLSECRRPADGGKLPYAVCFVCGQSGHLSRDCTLNPNGIYPKGGACKVCHKRDHLADNCPEKKEEEAASTAPRLGTISDGALEDDYQHDFRETAAPVAAPAAPAVRAPRKIKF